MRQIEKEMLRAINERANWRKDNTDVRIKYYVLEHDEKPALSQSEDADASIARLANRGLRLVERDSEYADRLFGVVDEQGGQIGRADFEIMPEGHLEAYEMAIYPQHQGNGIMNEVYDAVEEITDRKIEPSGSLTDDGQKFWIRRDPAKMREYLKGTTSEDRLDSLFEDALSKSKDADDRLINIAERGAEFAPVLLEGAQS